MPDLPRVHTGEPLVRLSDDEIAYRADRGKWTLTEALFHLTGHKPPGYESVRHLQDHFWPAYHQAVDDIQMGNICRKIEQAGESEFIDSPATWFAWADGLGPKFIKVDKRMRRALSQLNAKSQSKGGSKPKYNVALQQFIDQLAAEFNGTGKPLTLSALETWLSTDAPQGESYESGIPDCDDIEIYDDKVWWIDSKGLRKSLTLRSIERYVERAKKRTFCKTA